MKEVTTEKMMKSKIFPTRENDVGGDEWCPMRLVAHSSLFNLLLFLFKGSTGQA